jgi:3-oxoacyl-[acyl-carrier-protein] synthase II
MGDVIEAQAIGRIYGDSPVVTGLKSYMGHTMGSCGVIEMIITLYMMQEGFMAPTLNLDKVDERCAMVKHAVNLLESDIRIAAIQNFAFGGVNTCLLVRKSD